MTEETKQVGRPAEDLWTLVKGSTKNSLVAAAVFSGVANLLMLVPAFYMLSVYDKAIASHSTSTLAVLSIITLLMFLALAAVEVIRTKLLLVAGARVDASVTPLIYEATFQYARRMGSHNATVEPLNDFTNLRQFASGKGAITVFDTPWVPIYLLVMFLFHPALGWLGVVAALIMLSLVLATQKLTGVKIQSANAVAQRNMSSVRGHLSNVEVITAMGMFDTIANKWRPQHLKVLAKQVAASDINGLFAAITKTFRLAIQSAAIGLGALLVLEQEISPGMLIAGSILIGRALQPIELAVGSWKGFVDAKGQYQRLNSLLQSADWASEKMSLPDLRGGVTAVQATIVPPGLQTPALRNATFEIAPGSICMIFGPSGAGKSTLIRGILGLWPTSSGGIRIDGTKSSDYDRTEIGPQIGYLPQSIELFEGSVSNNIARQGELNSEDVIKAADDAGIHEFILSLPNGYDTELGGEGGVVLSPGQRQRLALARAIYRHPKLVVLDEPNSNLDRLGETALNRAIEVLRAAGSTVIIVSHREGAMALADQLIFVSSGEIIDSGPPEQVLQRLRGNVAASAPRQKLTVETVPI